MNPRIDDPFDDVPEFHPVSRVLRRARPVVLLLVLVLLSMTFAYYRNSDVPQCEPCIPNQPCPPCPGGIYGYLAIALGVGAIVLGTLRWVRRSRSDDRR